MMELKEFAWNSFEKTGSIESYLLFKNIEEHQEDSTLKNLEVAADEVLAAT